MFELTDKDWQAIASVGGVMLAVALGATIGGLVRRWRKGEPLIRKSDLTKFFENFGFFLAIVIAIPVSELVERATGNAWAEHFVFFAVIMIFVLPSAWLAKRRMDAVARETGVDNPDGLDKVPSVPASAEEKRVGWLMIGGLLVIAFALTVLAIMVTVWAVGPIKEGVNPQAAQAMQWRLWLAMGTLLAVMAGLLYAIVGRWPGRISSKGSIEISATPEQIWEALKWSAGMAHWKGIYRRIERLNEAGEVYRLHYFADANCAECGLPKHPDDSSVSQRVEIIEAVEPRIYRTKSFPKGIDATKGDTAKWLDCEEDCYAIMPLPGGKCRVDLECAADRPKIWMAMLIKLGGPVKQSLAVLKAHLEGSEDNTIYKTARDRFAAARLAPRHCGCAEAPVGSGLVSA